VVEAAPEPEALEAAPEPESEPVDESVQQEEETPLAELMEEVAAALEEEVAAALEGEVPVAPEPKPQEASKSDEPSFSTHVASLSSRSTSHQEAANQELGWGNIRGVTGDVEREKELGAGKWAESARTLDDVRSQMTSAPVRDMDLSGSEPPWTLIVFAGLALLAGLGWWLMSGDSEPSVQTPEDVSAQVLPEATQATPGTPQVTVDTVPPGGRVMLDDRDYGNAPTTVPVPMDGGYHRLCVEAGIRRSCRELTGTALAQSDPYVFELGQ